MSIQSSTSDEEPIWQKSVTRRSCSEKMHASFITTSNTSDYNESGGNILVIINSNKMVINWLTQHIKTMDKKIGEYAKTL